MLQDYVVLYRDDTLLPADAPLAFKCSADDTEHAEEQCTDAYPGCDIVWVVDTGNIDIAYQDYWVESYPRES